MVEGHGSTSCSEARGTFIFPMICPHTARDSSTFAEKHAAKMAWIEGVKRRTEIADHTDKANEQHYEVRVLVMLSEVPELTCPIGPHGVHHLHPRSCRQVLVMLVSNRSGDT